jgi:flagellar hook-basal body complex protein FliE
MENSRVLEREYFTPALQQAMRKAASDRYTTLEIINGAVNAYLNMLKAILLRNRAVSAFLNAQADYVDRLDKRSLH